MRQHWLPLGLFLLACVSAAPLLAADPREPLSIAITPADIASTHCTAYADGREFPAPAADVLSAALGLTMPNNAGLDVWSTGPVASEIRHFRIVFKQPVTIGTICTSAESVSLLRDTMELPGEIANDAHWQPLPKGLVRTLAPQTTVRAIRITLRHHNLPWEASRPPAVFPGLWLLTGRYFNPAEFGRSSWSSVPLPVDPKAKSSAKQPKGSQLQWLGYWPATRDIAGLLCSRPLAEAIDLHRLDSQQLLHPQLAQPTDWRTLTATRKGPILIFKPSPSTHAVRLLFDPQDKRNSRDSTLPDIIPLVALKDAEPAPSSQSFSFVEAAPVALKYDMPLNGFAAIRIEDSTGKHVRRLVAEVEREKGPVAEPWNLRDDADKLVPPGSYRFVGLARPPLKLTYEMSVYNAGHPPWMAPVPGGGWWMADHSPPVAVCAVKDVLIFGSLGAEFGTPLIATDREGKKLWHDLHQGVERLVSDGRYAYVVNNDVIIRIDPENQFAKHTLHKFQYTDAIPGHASGYIVADRSGAAVFGNTLCVSYSGRSAPWIRSAIKSADIDLQRTFPRPLPRKVHETALTPNELVLSTFQTMTSSTAASFGPAPRKGPLANTLLLSLTHEIPVGSVVLPRGDVQVWALRPGKKLPPEFVPPETLSDPASTGQPDQKNDLLDDVRGDLKTRFDPQTWVPLKTTPSDRSDKLARPDIAVPAEGLTTRLLAFTSPTLERLEYSLILDRRYRNATADAKFIPLEGKPTDIGGWEIRRPSTQPISYGSPAVAGYVWPTPRSIRGFLLTRPLEWSGIAVDVWTGESNADINTAAFQDNTHWRQVHLHRQTRNHVKFNWHTDRVISGDFGELISTRAIRVRIVEPPQGAGAPTKDTVIGGFESLLTFEPIGKDPVLSADLSERITLLDLPQSPTGTATVRTHLPVSRPTALAFDSKGQLYVASDVGISRLSLNASTTKTEGTPALETIIPRTAVRNPRALAFDSSGQLYVLDGSAQRVKIFDPQSGKFLREFGKSGGGVGPYDPSELSVPVAMSFDNQEKLWIVEQHFQPKRITRWSKEGTVEKQLLGPTHYGGGGMLDPGDKTVINHLGMKFRIDYATRTWKLESRLAPYGANHYLPDRVVYWEQSRYLVGDRPVVTPFGDAGSTSVICEERAGVAVPIVASGVLGDWKEFSKNPPLQQLAKHLNPSSTPFIWTDRNRDSVVQTEEVQLIRNLQINRAPFIGNDFSLNFPNQRGGARLRPIRNASAVEPPDRGAAATPPVVPLYDVTQWENVPDMTDEVWVTEKGETLVMSHKLLDVNGKLQWSYPDNYRGVQASNMVPWGFYSRPPGVIAGSIGPIGHFEVAGERLFCIGGNNGDYYAISHDGLLAAAILGGPRGYGRRFFSMPECIPGQTDLSDLRKTVEDFHGHVTRAEDGHVYAIAGKNHVSLLRVDGMEQMKRFQGTLEVTRDHLVRTQQWAASNARLESFLDDEGPKRHRVVFFAKKPTIDGDILTDWPEGKPVTIHLARNAQGKVVQQTQARLGFDSDHLYVAATSLDHSPLVNSAEDPAVLFQHGDALDVQLGLDPKAPADRNEAVSGDLRLLISSRGDKPVVMLYRYVDDPARNSPSPRTSKLSRIFRSPVGETRIAEILELTDCKVSILRNQQGWTIEAALPWKSLGTVPPSKSLLLRGDLGCLESDPNGITTVARHYWGNKRQVVLGDQPAEARVIPSLWGEFEFADPDVIGSLLDP